MDSIGHVDVPDGFSYNLDFRPILFRSAREQFYTNQHAAGFLCHCLTDRRIVFFGRGVLQSHEL